VIWLASDFAGAFTERNYITRLRDGARQLGWTEPRPSKSHLHASVNAIISPRMAAAPLSSHALKRLEEE
jgi:hypothetical protein